MTETPLVALVDTTSRVQYCSQATDRCVENTGAPAWVASGGRGFRSALALIETYSFLTKDCADMLENRKAEAATQEQP